jgi:hypothetical protein
MVAVPGTVMERRERDGVYRDNPGAGMSTGCADRH